MKTGQAGLEDYTSFMELRMSRPEKVVRALLDKANIQVGGNRDQDIEVRDPVFYPRVFTEGSLGLGESYMNKQWEANRLEVFIEKVLRSNLKQYVQWNLSNFLAVIMATVTNKQNRKRSTQVAREHYDLSGVLPDALLDPYNQYTCAYFDNTDDLNVAQEKKMDLICRKLNLQKNDRLLDIGCGWGGFSKFSAERYGCSVTGISISKEQISYASDFCKGLPVDIKYCDYRDIEGEYDKVLICGMIEHVGYKNYRKIFKKVYDHISDNGLFLLHTIGSNLSGRSGDPFINKYIFPNGLIPSIKQLDKAREGMFSVQDVQNLAAHYAPTLMAWYKNFQNNWTSISTEYDERFRRMFEYYLLASAGAFRAGYLQHWQFVFSKGDQVMDYRGAR